MSSDDNVEGWHTNSHMHTIGGGNRGSEGTWPLLNLRPLYRIVIFAVENLFSLAKWPLYFQWLPPPVMHTEFVEINTISRKEVAMYWLQAGMDLVKKQLKDKS